jgi:hypothetical protein
MDAELVERARADSSVVVTFDLDFGDILALGVLDKPSVIICRLADERAESVNQRLAKVLAERVSDLESGALILIEDTRYRVRRLPFGRTWTFESPNRSVEGVWLGRKLKAHSRLLSSCKGQAGSAPIVSLRSLSVKAAAVPAGRMSGQSSSGSPSSRAGRMTPVATNSSYRLL